jgi:DNA (cytosine-5)-methyltransferase 1
LVIQPHDFESSVPTSIELFTGAGGLALGVANAGFEHRLLVEYNRDACRSLRLNFPRVLTGECLLHAGDVKEVDFKVHRDKIDLLAAGAPCQPFSIGGKHKAHKDERNLFPDVFRAVREVKPRAVIIENVKGLTRATFTPYLEYIQLQLSMPELLLDDPDAWQAHVDVLRRHAATKKRGDEVRYRVNRQILNAANHGVPQKRERVFIVAIRDDIEAVWKGVPTSHSADILLYEQWVSGDYWKRHHIRRPATPLRLQKRVAALAKKDRPDGKAWQTVRDALVGLPEPKDREECADVLNHIGQPGARPYPGHTGSPLDEPAKTLKAGVHGVPGGENMLRRDKTVRYFTVREAARIQTFPDSYHIEGAWGEALRQLGNAVPVKLAEAVALSVMSLLPDSRPSDSPKRTSKSGHQFQHA